MSAPHPERLAAWAPALGPDAPRGAMAACPRVGLRVREAAWRAAFGHEGPMPAMERRTPARVAARATPAFLERVGLCWHAPVLASALLTGAGRAAFGPLSRGELEGVVRHRHHAPPDLVGRPAGRLGCEAQGMRCLHAWLDRFPAPEADAVRLGLPPIAPEGPAVIRLRAALLASVLEGEA